MARGRPKAEPVLSAEQREQLESLANSRFLPAGLGWFSTLNSLKRTPLRGLRLLLLTSRRPHSFRQELAR